MKQLQINPEGKVALVSGSNRGIGKAIAEELLNRGAKKVYAGARNVESLSELKEQYGDRLVPVSLDVTDDKSIKSLSDGIEDLDILVNNAGVFAMGSLLSGDAINSLSSNIDVNLWGTIKLSNAVVGKLKKSNESAIVNISSVAGLANMPFAATYSVSKAALHSTTQGMRAELADENVLVMGVYPGPVDTDMTKSVPMEKETPANVAKNVVQGLIEGKEDVFPDPMSEKTGTFYATNPKGVETELGAYK